jgi:hydrogenase nickel incorporation protein HypA/HybF
MHELSIMSCLLEAVEERAQQLGARKILAIDLVLGERSGVVDSSLQFYFAMLVPGTLAEGAQIHIRRTAMRFHCDGCTRDYTLAGADFRCPDCGVVGRMIDDGSDLWIESIEIET